MADLGTEKDIDYYSNMIEQFSRFYGGIDFRWKLIEKPGEEPSLLDSFKLALKKQLLPEAHSIEESQRFIDS